jgi:hypothetical protein
VWNYGKPSLFQGLRVIFDPRSMTAPAIRGASVGSPALTTSATKHAVE